MFGSPENASEQFTHSQRKTFVNTTLQLELWNRKSRNCRCYLDFGQFSGACNASRINNRALCLP